MLLVSALNSDFESLRAKNHSGNAKREFISNLKLRLDCGFDALNEQIIAARSNLNFERLSENFELLSFDVAPIRRFRPRLNAELVGWRHAVAHGNPPDLSPMDIGDHIDFTSNLLALLADGFQEAMLRRL
jgi:hypothetical protein